MGRGEDEPAPDATMLIGDEVLWEKKYRKYLYVYVGCRRFGLFRIGSLTNVL